MSLRYSTDKLSLFVKTESQRLGFYACGIAPAHRVDAEESALLDKWISCGGNASMDYMARNVDKRLNPSLLMPGVKSIVSVAMNYAPKEKISADEYQFAVYAYGRDYHDLMRERLRQLEQSITDFLERTKTNGASSLDNDVNDEITTRSFCDTAPVLERYWAVKAGLGWIGRNHQLIIPGRGSMFFLGEVFVSVEMDYDKPMKSRCGTCRACLDACPTQAITEGRAGLDARRCLSYQTIENRNDIPSDIASKMGNVVYGCDRCQQACPWNRFALPTEEEHLRPSEDFLQMKQSDWESLNVEDYRRLFKGSAVKRAKYEGLMRNIRLAADCKGSEEMK